MELRHLHKYLWKPFENQLCKKDAQNRTSCDFLSAHNSQSSEFSKQNINRQKLLIENETLFQTLMSDVFKNSPQKYDQNNIIRHFLTTVWAQVFCFYTEERHRRHWIELLTGTEVSLKSSDSDNCFLICFEINEKTLKA